MPSPIAVPIKLSREEREVLEGWTRRRTTASALSLRARIVLAAEAGENNTELAARLGVHRNTVSLWRRRFLEFRLDGLLDEPRPGQPRKITDAQVERVITKTLEAAPRNATHWSTRSMAAEVGLSQTAVSRIWRAFGLKPHQQETWKLSKDPLFVDKVRDVVGLYLNPPERAVVLCVDEKSQIQALDRTAPILPMRPGLVLVAEPRRALVLRADHEKAPTWRAHINSRPQPRHPGMDRDLERRPPPLRMDQDRRPDPHIHHPLLHNYYRLTTLACCGSRMSAWAPDSPPRSSIASASMVTCTVNRCWKCTEPSGTFSLIACANPT